MSNRILVLYGSYRSDRMGIRLAQFVIDRLRRRGEDVELIDAKAIGLPMLDRMYKEHPKGQAPDALEKLATQIREADGFVFVTGEYNWGIQPGLKNLTDHFLEEWFWRPGAIVSYSAGRFSGARAATASISAKAVWYGVCSGRPKPDAIIRSPRSTAWPPAHRAHAVIGLRARAAPARHRPNRAAPRCGRWGHPCHPPAA